MRNLPFTLFMLVMPWPMQPSGDSTVSHQGSSPLMVEISTRGSPRLRMVLKSILLPASTADSSSKRMKSTCIITTVMLLPEDGGYLKSVMLCHMADRS